MKHWSLIADQLALRYLAFGQKKRSQPQLSRSNFIRFLIQHRSVLEIVDCLRLARVLRGLNREIEISFTCVKPEQVMQNLRYYFETTRPAGRRAYRKNPARSFDLRDRQVQTIQAMIAEVDHSIMVLDRSIAVEQERAIVNDRSHYAYPMSARAMETRRDNLKMTRDALLERLASLAISETNFAAVAA